MSKDEDNQPSDAKTSEEKRSLRPTVFSPPIAASRKKAREGQPLANSSSALAPVTPTVLKPTALPGAERRRIEVSARDLKTQSPGATPEVLQTALTLLSTFVVEKATERKAILWGHELQKSYSNLVTSTLALSQSPLLRKVEGYLTRMMDILASIDLMAVCGQREGGIGQLFWSVNKKIDTIAELNDAQVELDQLVKYLSVALDELLDLKDKLEHHSVEVNVIGVKVEASALAALFLSQHLQRDNSAVAQRFLERSMALTQTLAQIRSGDSMREMQIEQPIRMVKTVQDVALVMMPGFLGGVAAALTLIDRKKLTPTQAGELTYQLRDILQQLRT